MSGVDIILLWLHLAAAQILLFAWSCRFSYRSVQGWADQNGYFLMDAKLDCGGGPFWLLSAAYGGMVYKVTVLASSDVQQGWVFSPLPWSLCPKQYRDTLKVKWKDRAPAFS